MTSLLKFLEPSNLSKDVKKETKKIKQEIEYDLETIGEYLLFGGIIGILVGFPFVNFIAAKIPEALDEAVKVANIVKPI